MKVSRDSQVVKLRFESCEGVKIGTDSSQIRHISLTLSNFPHREDVARLNVRLAQTKSEDTMFHPCSMPHRAKSTLNWRPLGSRRLASQRSVTQTQ